MMERDMMISSEGEICLRGVMEIMKEFLSQKFATYHLPSALDLIHNHHMNLLSSDSKTNNWLVDLSIIITGATSGIGLQTARELAIAGAHVVMACRNTKVANEIATKWREDQAHNGDHVKPNVEVMELDLLSLSSVRRFAVEWLQREKPLHVLINNAGVLMMGEPHNISEDGIEQHMQVNHFAPALLTLLLLPSLQKASSSKIINVNSVEHFHANVTSITWFGGHHSVNVDTKNWNKKIEEPKFGATKALGSTKAYCASKLLHLMFLKGLANKLFLDKNKASNIQCIAVHPGIVTSNLVSAMRGKTFWLLDTSEGARTVIFCVTNPNVADDLIKGFVYYSCNCKPGRVSPQADNMEACLEVLQKTLDVLQLDAAADYI